MLSPKPEPGALIAGHNCPISGDSCSETDSCSYNELGQLATVMSWLHHGSIAAHHHILICHPGDSESEELSVSSHSVSADQRRAGSGSGTIPMAASLSTASGQGNIRRCLFVY